jgi:V8-like Glu-specific endopeptidase
MAGVLMKRLTAALVTVLCAATAALLADEGMWTFDNVPLEEIAKKYNVRLSDEWLARYQKAVVRLETGCTGTFVTPNGLALTNHHCVQSCLAENSSAKRDFVAAGFQGTAAEPELRCQGERASVLMETQNVTGEVTRALAGVATAEAARARNQALTKLEEQCETSSKQAGTPLKCEAVTLYQGGQYWLYKYKRYDDVRLAFAPESAVAAFGGDPDNFQFPRWCLDMSLLRVYENGKPATPPSHLPFNWAGAKEGEPVFVAGHPGTTDRLLTAAQLRTQRDMQLPFWLVRFSELRGRLIQYSKTSPEAARTAKDYLDTIENSHKVRRMQLTTLLRDPVIEHRLEQERKLREAIDADPELKARAGTAFDDIAKAEARYREILIPYTWIEGGAGFNSDLFVYARALVRAADERMRPSSERLREYTDAQLAALKQQLGAEAPVYPALEQVRLSYALERMREYLGPDHPIIKQALGAVSPDQRAKTLISGSTLGSSKVRLSLFDGGKPAVEASRDPIVVLARAMDDEARRLRRIYETEVEGPIQRAQQAIADARFKVYGTSIYPDATFTLRLSYGAVKGWTEDGTRVEPFTRIGRMYERVTAVAPFALPKRWIDAKPRLDSGTFVNFATTHDIVGGNSGSSMVNAKGEIVGLIFDGNIHSIAGSYWYDPERNRAVSVHPAYIRTALEQVYQQKAIAQELGMGAGVK